MLLNTNIWVFFFWYSDSVFLYWCFSIIYKLCLRVQEIFFEARMPCSNTQTKLFIVSHRRFTYLFNSVRWCAFRVAIL